MTKRCPVSRRRGNAVSERCRGGAASGRSRGDVRGRPNEVFDEEDAKRLPPFILSTIQYQSYPISYNHTGTTTKYISYSIPAIPHRYMRGKYKSYLLRPSIRCALLRYIDQVAPVHTSQPSHFIQSMTRCSGLSSRALTMVHDRDMTLSHTWGWKRNEEDSHAQKEMNQTRTSVSARQRTCTKQEGKEGHTRARRDGLRRGGKGGELRAGATRLGAPGRGDQAEGDRQ